MEPNKIIFLIRKIITLGATRSQSPTSNDTLILPYTGMACGFKDCLSMRPVIRSFPLIN